MSSDLFDGLRLEMRRGCLVLAVLAALQEEQYGYTLGKSLTDSGLDIDQGTLYPLLRRLETQGLLASQWRETGKRNKRFYQLTGEGRRMLDRLFAEWEKLSSAVGGILKERNHATRGTLSASGEVLAAGRTTG
jgi:PadR family transcriptional regulator